MDYSFFRSKGGGASIQYALFLCVAALAIVGGVALVGEQLRPQVVAWGNSQKVDNTLTGSIKKDTGPNTYRVFQLPDGLKPDNTAE